MLKLQLQLIPLMLIIMRFLFVFDVFSMEFVVLLAADFVQFGGYFSLSYFLQYKWLIVLKLVATAIDLLLHIVKAA